MSDENRVMGDGNWKSKQPLNFYIRLCGTNWPTFIIAMLLKFNFIALVLTSFACISPLFIYIEILNWLGILVLSRLSPLVCIIVLQLRPNFADAWANLASAYLLKGRFNEAAQCCRQALALNPHLVGIISILKFMRSARFYCSIVESLLIAAGWCS